MLDEADNKVLADVEEYGWHCMHVHDEGELPYWSFSIGVFRRWKHPELIVFGLEDTLAHDLITQLVSRINTGESFSPGRDYNDILEGYRCRFVPSIRVGTPRTSDTPSGSTRLKTGSRSSSLSGLTIRGYTRGKQATRSSTGASLYWHPRRRR
jgi:Domain of unknown function (DUF4262)